MELAGRTAVVTGAGSKGVGRAICLRFASLGARIVACDVNESGCRETARLVQQNGGDASAHLLDVRLESEWRRLFHRFAHSTVLVNNASAEYRPDEPLDHWQNLIETDLLGSMSGTRVAIDAMRTNGCGSIVNVASISALWHGRLSPGICPAYDVAKMGLIRFTTTLHWLAAAENIRVNCFAPGWIGSEHVRSYWDSLTPEQRTARDAPDRILSLEQAAEAVYNLAADDRLAGRVLVWWSTKPPRLIAWGDRGYQTFEEYPPFTPPARS